MTERVTVEIGTVEYAIRYCLTRRSYALDDGLNLAHTHWDNLSDSTRADVMKFANQHPDTLRRSCRPLYDRLRHTMTTTTGSAGR